MRAVLFALIIALSAATIGVAPATGQAGPNWTVSIDFPDQFTVGENRIEVTVTNNDATEELFSPIVEIPLENGLDTTNPNPQVEFDGNSETRTYQVTSSSFRSGDALYVYGEEVPASESRTYVFTLDVETAGSRTITADVRPLYNEDQNVRTSASKDAIGLGTTHVRVEDPDGTVVSSATVTVDGQSYTGGSQSVDLPVGTYAVSASTTSTSFPSLSVRSTEFETLNITYVRQTDRSDPVVVAYTGDDSSVSTTSVDRLVDDPGNASAPRRVNVSFAVDVANTSVIELEDPALIAPADSTGISATGGTMTRPGGNVTRVVVDTPGVNTVTVSYVGYRIGDIDLDGSVDAADASRAAQKAVAGAAANQYGDVNDDGQVTAVDAMLIAQKDADNRTNDYGRK